MVILLFIFAVVGMQLFRDKYKAFVSPRVQLNDGVVSDF